MDYTHVKFKPWIGSQYKNGNPKILVLGESHYGLPLDRSEPNFTSYLLGRHISGKDQSRFFTNIANMFGEAAETRETFWQSVAFYNYVQGSVGHRPRTEPQDHMWNNSAYAFQEVLTKHRPEYIVVLGFRNWDRIKCGNANTRNGLTSKSVHPKKVRKMISGRLTGIRWGRTTKLLQ